MLEADIAITGGGQTTYELAACGTPAVAVCLAENQNGILRALAREGTLLLAGDPAVSDVRTTLTAALRMLALSPERRLQMSARGRKLVVELGVQRVAMAIADEHERMIGKQEAQSQRPGAQA